MSDAPAIRTHGLTRHFGETVAVEDLTLEVQAGEIFGFLGHNGAGKTTTIRLLTGILEPTAGSSCVLNRDPQAEGATLRRQVGVLTETPALEERLSGRLNLEIYAALYGVPSAEREARVAELLTAFDLAERAEDAVGSYSKGMKQRMALARALLHRPPLLFLDEPTSGLDPVATREVHELIRRLSRQEGHTVFLCTHNLAEAQKLCHRVGVMERGRLIAAGTPETLTERLGERHRVAFEVDPRQVPLATQVLRDMPDVTLRSQDGGRLVVQGLERVRIPEAVFALSAAGARVYRVAPQTPSLEDVYFALHRRGERNVP
jgi:ABC-2 type transport system ATP-binding protein